MTEKQIKRVYIFMAVVIGSFAVGVLAIFVYGCSSMFCYTPPKFIENLNEYFELEIPEGWTNLYFNGTRDLAGAGTEYYIFEVTERDEEFFKEFSAKKNAEFESEINYRLMKFQGKNKTPVESEFMFDFNRPYEWYKAS